MPALMPPSGQRGILMAMIERSRLLEELEKRYERETFAGMSYETALRRFGVKRARPRDEPARTPRRAPSSPSIRASTERRLPSERAQGCRKVNPR
jgi:hypothetical protein